MGLFSGLEHVVRDGEPLAPYTWLRLGGPAEFFAEPTSVEELASLVRRCHERAIPARVVGGGSNVLIPDDGVRGLVVNMAAAAFCQISVRGNTIAAGGGAKLGHVVSTAVRVPSTPASSYARKSRGASPAVNRKPSSLLTPNV